MHKSAMPAIVGIGLLLVSVLPSGAASALTIEPSNRVSGPVVSAISPTPFSPSPQTLKAPQPYDDLTSSPCGSTAQAITRISTIAGKQGEDVWVLAGDTLELVGAAKGCQIPRASTSDVAEWGFTAAEVDWLYQNEIDPEVSLGDGVVVRDGRTAIPTETKIEYTASTSDDNSTFTFGTIGRVRSPNGRDNIDSTTSITMRVANPQLKLTKQVCANSTIADCDPSDASLWLPSSEIEAGSDVIWRLTAENTGNLPLRDVRVGADELEGATASANTCLNATVAASLDPGASVSIACSTANVDATGTAVNTAKLTSTFTDPTATPGTAGRLLSRFPQGVESNASSAEVSVLKPALSLVKEVCLDTKPCDPTDDSQWGEMMVVPNKAAVTWRLTAANTGNTVIENVTVGLEVLSGAKTGTSEECAALTFGTLDPGKKASATCVTETITGPTTNTASIHGEPVATSGAPLRNFAAGVDSETAQASVTISKKGDPVEPTDPIIPDDPNAGNGGAGSGSNPGSDSAASSAGGLALTGAESLAALSAAALLVMTGFGAIAIRRMRRNKA